MIPDGYWTQERCFEEAQKYSSKQDFRKSCSSAYTIAWRHGWLSDYTWFKRPDMTQKWTQDACYKEAQKYHTIKEFRENSNSCYVTASSKGWLKDYTWLERADNNRESWTKEECIEESKKYKTLNDFHNNSCGAYTAAWRNGWLKEFTWLKRQISEPYTFKQFAETVQKYETLKEFREKEYALYSAAKKNKWLDSEEFNSLTRLSKPNGYWTKEHCAEEALKYESLTDFCNNSPSAYGSAWRNGWLREITTHMKTKIIPEELYHQKHVIYVYKDEVNHYAYVGLTNNIYVRDTTHRDANKHDTLYKHFHKYNIEIPKPEIVCSDLTPHQAQDKEREFYYQYRDAGWNMINSEKSLGSLGSHKRKWTYIKTYKEAKKYKYPVDFKNSAPGAYAAASRNGWLKDYTWLQRRR